MTGEVPRAYAGQSPTGVRVVYPGVVAHQVEGIGGDVATRAFEIDRAGGLGRFDDLAGRAVPGRIRG